jgi:signal transduction histidine kinase
MNESRLEKIGSAAAGIAHDINNQLNLIVNHLSLPVVDGTGVEGALQAAERCSALTTSLLSYCKIGRIPVVSLDPAECLRSLIPQLSLPEGIDLELDIPASLPLIRANSLAVKRALLNLIANAVDAMHGEGTLRISASRQAIEVADSGPGIPGKHFKRIFEPFYSTKGKAGFGLGLAIVRETMRELGGCVTVTSELGKGACFRLQFRPAFLRAANTELAAREPAASAHRLSESHPLPGYVSYRR